MPGGHRTHGQCSSRGQIRSASGLLLLPPPSPGTLSSPLWDSQSAPAAGQDEDGQEAAVPALSARLGMLPGTTDPHATSVPAPSREFQWGEAAHGRPRAEGPPASVARPTCHFWEEV